ncbi:MAG: DUF6447 family protein [Rhizobiaceae bacterium]|nr:DUF6447 family protein [Rhizobiaceae bacterium]
MADERNVVIDGKSYPMAEMSDAAKKQLANVQLTEGEITRLKLQLAIAETAKAAYGRALKAELEKTLIQ